jgi:phosphonate transport system ATP-binding protein
MVAPTAGNNPGTTGSGNPLLDARDIWFSYDSRSPVLCGVDVAVERGQVVMVLGRSGGGKTTLLKVLKGLLRADRGSITFRSSAKDGGSAGRIAYIPQTLGLVRSLTALENVLTGALTRVPVARSMVRSFPGEIVAEAKQTLVHLGLAEKTNEAVFNLSGGERQRVAIGRALMQKPELILADEFVSQLDHVTAKEILQLISDVARQGVGMLVTTHEIDVVMSHADRVLVMRDGRMIRDAAAFELSSDTILKLMQ